MSNKKKLDFDEELKKYLAYTQEQFQSPDMDSPNLRIEGDRIVDERGVDYTDLAEELYTKKDQPEEQFVPPVTEYHKDPNKMLSFPQGIRKAAWDAKSRQAQHLEDALTKGYELADTLDRTFNPESYAQRRSGRGAISMPVGGRAGMANLYRPQYEADMNEAFVAPKMVMDDKQQMVKSNDDYAERNKAKGYLGINKRDDGSVYYTGSEQVRQNLEKEIAEIKKQIKLEETLQQLDLANDPAWGAAKISFIYNGDRSGIDAIANRIEAKIGREFTAAENEKSRQFQSDENQLNRDNAIDIAKLNKEEQKAAQIEDARGKLKKAKNILFYRVSQAENDPWNDDGGLVLSAWNDYQDALKDLDKLGASEDDAVFASMLKGNFPTVGDVGTYVNNVAPKRAEKQRLLAAATNPEIRSDQLFGIYKQLSDNGLGSPKELQEIGDKYVNLKKKENKKAAGKAKAKEDKDVATWIANNRAGTSKAIDKKAAEASAKWPHRKFTTKQLGASSYTVEEVK